LRAGRLALWAFVVVGALGGAVSAVSAIASPSSAPPISSTAAASPPVGVAGVAEMAVRQWLTTDSAGPADGDASVAAVSLRAVGAGYWAVTVAADLHHADPPEAGQGRWYLEVGVVAHGAALVAAGPPVVVPPPPSGEPVTLAGPTLRHPAPDDPLAATAEAFLSALLTGGQDPSRYASPAATFQPTPTAAFAEVAVRRTAVVSRVGVETVLRAEAAGRTPTGVELLMLYELTLVPRDGRWEVQALSGAPTLRRPPNRATSTTSSAPPQPTPSPAPVPGA
jgi:hypothetical protein